MIFFSIQRLLLEVVEHMIFLACSATSSYWLVRRSSLLIVPARVSAGLFVCGVESLLSGIWQRGDFSEAGSERSGGFFAVCALVFFAEKKNSVEILIFVLLKAFVSDRRRLTDTAFLLLLLIEATIRLVC